MREYCELVLLRFFQFYKLDILSFTLQKLTDEQRVTLEEVYLDNQRSITEIEEDIADI